MIGVSPSFIFSNYSTDFSVEDYKNSLKNISKLGFKCFQGEIFKEEKIEEWEKGLSAVLIEANNQGLKLSAFSAHCLIHFTETGKALLSDNGYLQFERICKLFKNIHDTNIIILPIGTFQYQDETYKTLQEGLEFRINRYCQIAKKYKLKIALEILPHSLVGSTTELLNLINKLKLDNLGLNLDTGHANCSGEILSLLPNKLKGKIFSTHLKDNFGEKNLSLPPGKGSIDFTTLLKKLKENGYPGTFDLEIGTDKNNVNIAYSSGLKYISQLK